MIKKKICLIGAYAVGKTSLVRQFVSGSFSDVYLTTVGVKIDQRSVTMDDGRVVRLMIWDLAGRDEFEAVRKTYIAGASGFLYVADGTRRETLESVWEEMSEIETRFPEVPSVLLLNKRDLTSDWEIDDAGVDSFRAKGLPVHFTSARTGEHVAESFDELASRMIAPDRTTSE